MLLITVFPENKIWGDNEKNLWKQSEFAGLVILWAIYKKKKIYKAITYSTEIKWRWNKYSKIYIAHILSKGEEIMNQDF